MRKWDVGTFVQQHLSLVGRVAVQVTKIQPFAWRIEFCEQESKFIGFLHFAEKQSTGTTTMLLSCLATTRLPLSARDWFRRQAEPYISSPDRIQMQLVETQDGKLDVLNAYQISLPDTAVEEIVAGAADPCTELISGLREVIESLINEWSVAHRIADRYRGVN